MDITSVQQDSVTRSCTELIAESQQLDLALQPITQGKGTVLSSTYGKGRLIERKHKGSQVTVFPPSRPPGTLVVNPDEAVRYAAWLEVGSLELLDLSRSSGGQAAWQNLRSCHPAHLRDSGVAEELITELSLEQLGRHFTQGPDVQATVCIGGENRLQECDPEKNAFGTAYHVREPRCRALRLHFRDFAQHLRQWTSKSVMLRLPVRLWEAEEEAPLDFALRESPACPEGLHKVMRDKIAWEWLQGLQLRHRMGAVTQLALEIGGRNALLPARYSTHDRFLAQVVGTRRVLLIPPEHSFDGMYPYPLHHPYDGYSMVDWEAPDVRAWPRSCKVRGKLCMLDPGDILFVPSCWWLHQQLLGPENAALEFVLSIGYRVRPPAAITLRVSRVVEELLGDIDGPQRVLQWLLLLSAEEEEDVVDTTTVAGFKQIEAVWDARDAVDDVLGWKAWKRVFPAMCAGRLRPTPWLNKDFKEALYLTDKPKIVEDTRTEEQRRFPELFRHVKW